jgi:hypothetical protein
MERDPYPDIKVHLDYLLTGTPFRGLVLQTPFCYCAYLGVPKTHWLADMSDLNFDCHFGVTFSGEGDGRIRPAGWYWYGWDYAHFTDHISIPLELLDALPEWIPVELKNLMSRPGKTWTLAEIEQDLLDAAMDLKTTLDHAQELAQASTARLQNPAKS